MGKSLFHGISRRNFIRGAVGLAGASALAGCSSGSGSDGYSYVTEPKSEETLHDCACFNNCSNGCRLYAHVRKGRIVKMSRAPMPDRRYDRACLRGLSHMQRFYGRNRLLYPLKRVSDTRGDKDGFMRISWEQAASEIGAKLNSLRNTERSIGLHIGSGSFGSTHGRAAGGYNRLFGYLGAVNTSSSLDQNTAQGTVNAFGNTPVWTATLANSGGDKENSKHIFLWGTNPSSAIIQEWHHFAEARDNGAKLISIDIMLSGGTARADHFVCVKPATDALLALSMIKHIIEQGLYNEEYMFKNTVSHFLVVEDSSNTLGYGLNHKFLRRKNITGDNNAADAEDYVMLSTGSVYTYTTVTTTEPLNGKAVLDDIYSNYQLNADTTDTIYYWDSTNTRQQLSVSLKSAFQLLRKHVGSGDSTHEYDAEQTQAITGVVPEVTKKLAEIYADGPSVIVNGFGPDHQSNGHHIYVAMCTLAAITGNAGKPGTGVGHGSPIHPYLNTVGLNRTDEYNFATTIPFPMLKKVLNDPYRDTLEHYNYVSSSAPAGTYNANIYPMGGDNQLFYGMPIPMKAFFIACSNMVTNYCETGTIIGDNGIFTAKNADGSYKMEMVVVADIEMTDTAAYADYILPVCHWFEREDTHGFGSHPFLVYQEKVFEAAGESLNDTEIARRIANAMGLTNLFPETDEELFLLSVEENTYREYYFDRTGRYPSEEETLTAAKVRENKAMYALPVTEVNRHKEYIYPMRRVDNGADEPEIRVDTASGRIEFYSDSPFSLGQTFGLIQDEVLDDTARLPVFEPPYEAWTGTTDYPNYMETSTYLSEHPYHNFSQRIRWRVHTQWYSTPWIRELEEKPVVFLSATDAATIGVVAGDVVEIANDRGAYRGTVIISPGLTPGLIDAPRGWQRWQYNEHYGQQVGYALNSSGTNYAEDAGSCNDVTNSRVHVYSACQAFFDARVKITKIVKQS